MRLLRAFACRVAEAIEDMAVGWAGRCGTRRDAVFLSQRAWERIGAARWDSAIYYGRGAVAADATYAGAHRMLGYAYEGAGDLEKAHAAFEAGTRVAPGDPQLLLHLASVDMKLGHYDRAEAAYRRALAIEPGSHDVRFKLAQTLRGQGRLEEAETLLEQIRARGLDHPFILQTLGYLRADRGDFPGAVALLT